MNSQRDNFYQMFRLASIEENLVLGKKKRSRVHVGTYRYCTRIKNESATYIARPTIIIDGGSENYVQNYDGLIGHVDWPLIVSCLA